MPNQYRNIELLYKQIFESNASPEEQKNAGRNIIETIVTHVFFERPNIIQALENINQERKDKYEEQFRKKQNPRKPIYYKKNQLLSKVFFLCNYGYIPAEFQSAFLFIWSEGSESGTAHIGLGQGIAEFIHAMKLFLNDILEWFLKEENEPTDYLVL